LNQRADGSHVLVAKFEHPTTPGRSRASVGCASKKAQRAVHDELGDVHSGNAAHAVAQRRLRRRARIQFIDTSFSHLAIKQAAERFVVFQQGMGSAAPAMVAGPCDEVGDAANAMYATAHADNGFVLDTSTY
jgi:hypothetical protein